MEENNNSALSEQKTDAAAPEEKSQHHHSSGKSSHHRSSGKSSNHHRHHHSSSSGSSHHHHHHHSSSHHSSSSKSSKKKKKKTRKSTDHTKLRTFFSFMLFLSVFATSVFAGLKITVLNQSRIADVFTNIEYVDSLYEDVLDYSEDLCLKCSIPKACVEDVINYKNIDSIQSAYINGMLDMDEKYSESTYSDLINDLRKELEESVQKGIDANAVEISEAQQTDGVKSFSKEIASYLKSKVEFAYIADLQSILNVSAPITNIGIVLFAVLTVAFFLLVISIEGKSYRSIRPIAFSFLSAALMNFILVAFVGVVSLFKDLLIFPSYLCTSIMQYIHSCVSTFAFEGFILFFAGIIVCTLVWKLKRNNE